MNTFKERKERDDVTYGYRSDSDHFYNMYFCSPAFPAKEYHQGNYQAPVGRKNRQNALAAYFFGFLCNEHFSAARLRHLFSLPPWATGWRLPPVAHFFGLPYELSGSWKVLPLRCFSYPSLIGSEKGRNDVRFNAVFPKLKNKFLFSFGKRRPLYFDVVHFNIGIIFQNLVNFFVHIIFSFNARYARNFIQEQFRLAHGMTANHAMGDLYHKHNILSNTHLSTLHIVLVRHKGFLR